MFNKKRTKKKKKDIWQSTGYKKAYDKLDWNFIKNAFKIWVLQKNGQIELCNVLSLHLFVLLLMIELVALLALKDESDREIYHLLIFLLFVLRILVALSTLFLPRVTNIKIKINKDSPNIPYLMLHMILLSFAGLLKSCSDNQTNIVIIVLFHVNCLIIINQKF